MVSVGKSRVYVTLTDEQILFLYRYCDYMDCSISSVFSDLLAYIPDVHF